MPLLNRRLSARAVGLLAASLMALSTIAATGASVSAAPTQAELERARDRLMEIERDFQLVSEEYNKVHEELTQTQISIGQTELEVNEVEDRMETRTDSAVALARELYMGGTEVAIEAILSSRTITDVESRLAYLQTSEEVQSKVFETLAVDRAELNRNMGILEEQRAVAAAKEANLLDLRTVIEDKAASQKAEIRELVTAIERAERQAAARSDAASPTIYTPADVPPVKASNPNAQTVVDAALSQVGKPYLWGGEGPDSYDCSGLMMWAWAHAGVSLPHNSGMQYAATPRVAQDDWQPGDILFFGSPIHHNGMYIGNGQMVEAPYSGEYVRVNSAFRDDYAGAGRPGV